MHFLSLAVVGSFVIAGLAAPTARAGSYVAHESRRDFPKTWVKRSTISSGIKVPVRVGLTQRNLHKGYELLMEVLVSADYERIAASNVPSLTVD